MPLFFLVYSAKECCAAKMLFPIANRKIHAFPCFNAGGNGNLNQISSQVAIFLTATLFYWIHDINLACLSIHNNRNVLFAEYGCDICLPSLEFFQIHRAKVDRQRSGGPLHGKGMKPIYFQCVNSDV